MGVASQAPLDKQNTNSTLQQAEEAQQLAAQQLWNPAPASKCLLAHSEALVPAGFAIVQQRAGCTDAAVVTNSRSNLVPSPPNLPYVSKISDRTAVPLRFVFSVSPASEAAPGFDALSLYRSACGHRTLTSIQSWCRTPGNQETTSSIAHRASPVPILLC